MVDDSANDRFQWAASKPFRGFSGCPGRNEDLTQFGWFSNLDECMLGWLAYAENAVDSLVFRVSFCADAPVFHGVWHLADSRCPLEPAESLNDHPHIPHGEVWRASYKSAARGVYPPDGIELHGYDHFRRGDGDPIWKEPASRLLLSRGWHRDPAHSRAPGGDAMISLLIGKLQALVFFGNTP